MDRNYHHYHPNPYPAPPYYGHNFPFQPPPPPPVPPHPHPHPIPHPHLPPHFHPHPHPLPHYHPPPPHLHPHSHPHSHPHILAHPPLDQHIPQPTPLPQPHAPPPLLPPQPPLQLPPQPPLQPPTQSPLQPPTQPLLNPPLQPPLQPPTHPPLDPPPQPPLQPPPQPMPPPSYPSQPGHHFFRDQANHNPQPSIGHNCPPPGFSSCNNPPSTSGPSATEQNNKTSVPVADKGSSPTNDRKRCRPASPDHNENGGYTKLYVAPVPRTITTEDMWPLFRRYGNVVEVVFPMDKKQRLRGEYCFVKYSTRDEADVAIKALNGVYTIPGETLPIVVRYADTRRDTVSKVEVERAGLAAEKLYVGGINKHASKQEIREIFSVYGNVEDIYLGRDDMKQNRGFAFIKFSQLDMAMAAIKALHGIFTMRGCEQPLVVRFADPMKPRQLLGTTDISGGSLQSNNPHSGQEISSNNQISNQSNHSLEHHSSATLSDTQKQTQSSWKRDQKPSTLTVSSPESYDLHECDWSEHTCPDGYKYYYNCVSCESQWDIPEELAALMQKIQKYEKLSLPGKLHSVKQPLLTGVDKRF